MTPAERRFERIPQQTWWSYLTRDTRGRATVLMPRLQHERLEELGIDFSSPLTDAWPRAGAHPRRRVEPRGFAGVHTYVADGFAHFSDRMTPAAIVPIKRNAFVDLATNRADRSVREWPLLGRSAKPASVRFSMA